MVFVSVKRAPIPQGLSALRPRLAEVAPIEAALRLAIAEAYYHRALHKVDTHDTEPNSAQQVVNKLYADVRFVLDGLPEKVADGPADPFDLEYAKFGLRQSPLPQHIRSKFHQRLVTTLSAWPWSQVES